MTFGVPGLNVGPPHQHVRSPKCSSRKQDANTGVQWGRGLGVRNAAVLGSPAVPFENCSQPRVDDPPASIRLVTRS